MRCIVVPDIHTQVAKVERILAKEIPYDKVVFLGDYFDAFYDTVESNRQTALWLKDSLKNPKRVHLIGNHDLNYHGDNIAISCSGFTPDKLTAIREVLPTGSVWDKLRWHQIEQGWLLTHAGLDDRLHNLPAPSIKRLDNFLREAGMVANRAFINGKYHWFYEAGAARNGTADIGGIVWCDANDEFQPIPHVKQIFGHTFQRKGPRWIRGDMGLEMSFGNTGPKVRQHDWNLCLDTHLKNWAVIDDGIVEIKDYIDL